MKKDNLLYRAKCKLLGYVRYAQRAVYFRKLKRLIKPTTSVITSNCFAGRIMQDLKLQYTSPTEGLYFMMPDYLEFLKHLKYYTQTAKLSFVKHSRYQLGEQRRLLTPPYPIGLLDGKVEIHFLHYGSEKEAEEKWHRRCKRINFSDLLVIGVDQNLCTKNDMASFSNLPYKKKIFFSSKDVHHNGIVFMKEYANCNNVGDAYHEAHVFYKYLLKYASSQKWL